MVARLVAGSIVIGYTTEPLVEWLLLEPSWEVAEFTGTVVRDEGSRRVIVRAARGFIRPRQRADSSTPRRTPAASARPRASTDGR